jgi:serine palmitoyltransferase
MQLNTTVLQRINGAAFVFSAAMPGLLATTGSAAINIMQTTPQLYVTLQDNIRTFRTGLAKLEGVTIYIPSDLQSALIHIYMLSPPESIEQEEKLLQDVVDDALGQGVLICRAARLRGQEVFEPAPSLKIMISAAFTKKEMEKITTTVRNSLTKVLGSESMCSTRCRNFC